MESARVPLKIEDGFVQNLIASTLSPNQHTQPNDSNQCIFLSMQEFHRGSTSPLHPIFEDILTKSFCRVWTALQKTATAHLKPLSANPFQKRDTALLYVNLNPTACRQKRIKVNGFNKTVLQIKNLWFAATCMLYIINTNKRKIHM